MHRSALIALLLVSGCLPPRGTSQTNLNYYGRRYCTSPSYASDYVSGAATPEEALRGIMCSERPDGEYYVHVYRQMDPEHPDPLLVGLALVHCVGTGRCGEFNGTRQGPSAGMTSNFYRLARGLDIEAVSAALEGVNAPGEVKQSFLLRLDACRAHVIRSVDAMSPRLRAVFVDTIERTLADRAALRARTVPHQQLYAALRPEIDQALVHEGFTEDLHARARALRDGFVRDCMEGGTRSAALCANGPIARPLTELLARSALSLGRHAEGLAERELLASLGDVRDERVAIHIAVGEAIAREAALYRQYAAAYARMSESSPADRDRLLAEAFGPVPPVDMESWDNAAGLEPPERPSLPQADASVRTALVTRVRPVDRTSTQLVVEGGYVSDETRLVVPRDEAEHLQPGQRVELAVARGDERASVVRARSGPDDDSPVVQLRAFYFGD